MSLENTVRISVDLIGYDLEFIPAFGQNGGTLEIRLRPEHREIIATLLEITAEECRTKPADTPRDTYRAYLLSPEWRQRRLQALVNAGHECVLCSNNLDLEVHHRTYDRIGAEHEGDLIVLCGVCHTRHHQHIAA